MRLVDWGRFRLKRTLFVREMGHLEGTSLNTKTLSRLSVIWDRERGAGYWQYTRKKRLIVLGVAVQLETMLFEPQLRCLDLKQIGCSVVLQRLSILLEYSDYNDQARKVQRRTVNAQGGEA